MKEVSLVLFIKYPNGAYSHKENFERTKDAFARLAKIHPLLADLSWTEGNGRKPWLKLPIFRDVTLEQWTDFYQKNNKDDAQSIPQDKMISFWNRQADRSNDCNLLALYNNPKYSDLYNFFSMYDITPVLTKPDIMDAMMLAFIQAFDAISAKYKCSYYVLNPLDRIGSIYQLWLKHGQTFPVAGVDFDMPADHPAPPISEPWHGGTRYSWPENDPRIFFAAEE